MSLPVDRMDQPDQPSEDEMKNLESLMAMMAMIGTDATGRAHEVLLQVLGELRHRRAAMARLEEWAVLLEDDAGRRRRSSIPQGLGSMMAEGIRSRMRCLVSVSREAI